MRLYEDEARRLARSGGIPVPEHGVADDPAQARALAERLGGPVVVKARVLSGGRMRAGGVRFADTPEEAERAARDVLELRIGGRRPRGVLVDTRMAIRRELYAGVAWDGVRKRPVLLFSAHGGIDVEGTARERPGHVGRGLLSTLLPPADFRAREVVAAAGLRGPALGPAAAILARLAELFLRHDLTLAEINPLAQLEDGSLVALDAHMELDDDARARRRDLLEDLGVPESDRRRAREPTPFELAGEEIDATDHRGVAGNVVEFDGDLGLIVGGGGGSLALFDAVRAHGGRPANLCEIGGNPSVAKTCALARLVLGKPGVRRIAVMMSIVSNTRADLIARGVVKACLERGESPAERIAIFRVPGAWEDEARVILDRYGIEHADRSVSMDEAARRAVARAAA
jgi:succinyl-CoA synthetase beta subunit